MTIRNMVDPTGAGYRSDMLVIAIEVAFAIPEYLDAFVKEAATGRRPGIKVPALILSRPENVELLCDMNTRLKTMDENGVDMHVLSLTSPGVQIFDAEQATDMARLVNDRMAQIIRQHPTRFGGLATIAPHDPNSAAAEVERAIVVLGLNGVMINSHTDGEFLDDPKFYPILEVCERLKAPIYIHPTFPPEAMAKPFQVYNLDGALWGFAAETGLHAVRMVMGGVFDRFPELQIVLGHMGENLPFQLFRLDNVLNFLNSHAQKPPGMVELKKKPSEYIKSNIYITTSGMFWDTLLQFGLDTMGVDHLIFAIDYPYESSKVACEWIAKAPIAPGDKRAILSGNTEKMFRIK